MRLAIQCDANASDDERKLTYDDYLFKTLVFPLTKIQKFLSKKPLLYASTTGCCAPTVTKENNTTMLLEMVNKI